VSAFGFPDQAFEELEQGYSSGETEPSSFSASQVYHIGHKVSRTVRDTLVIFDIPDEALFSDTHEKNPRFLEYTDGILVIVDPLSVPSVRKENQSLGEMVPGSSYSTDDATDLINSFINLFKSSTGQASRRTVDIPIAIVVNKTDVKAVKRKIGLPKIAATFKATPGLFHSDYDTAAHDLCRDYLIEIGLDNALRSLETISSKVRFFPASAMGHPGGTGDSFNPNGVIAPVAWLAQESRSRLSGILRGAQREAQK